MVTKLAREVRCGDVLKLFTADNNKCCFMTLTTKDVVTLVEMRKRWRSLRHYLVEREGDGFKYVMNYELHPKGHGWHIHAVFNRLVNLRGEGLYQLRRYGFKMINVRKVTSLGVSLYLSKHCLKAYRGIRDGLKGDSKRLRLVNTSRGLPVLSDYHWSSSFLGSVRALVSSRIFKETFPRSRFQTRYNYAELCVLNGFTPDQLAHRLQLVKQQQRIIQVAIRAGADPATGRIFAVR